MGEIGIGGGSDGSRHRVCGAGLSDHHHQLMGAIMVKAAPAEQAEAAVHCTRGSPAAAPAVSGNKQQVVAAIAVAIAEEMGTDVSHIRIHSIKRV